MNMTVLFKKYTYWLLLITTTLIMPFFCNATLQCIDTEIEAMVECPTACTTGDMQSILNINEINHQSAMEINITIPEEIQREYTWDTETMNIEIIGYWYDQQAMQEMVNTQFTPPTSTDMEEIIAKIADFLPLLAVWLLFVWTWYIIKKVFRKWF